MGMQEIVSYTENYASSKPKYILATFSMLATVISQSRRLTSIFNALGKYCNSSGECHVLARGITHETGLTIFTVEYSLGFEVCKI